MQNNEEPRWIINPREVNQKQEARIRAWAHALMAKKEYMLNSSKYKDKQIVTRGYAKPEDIDIEQIYRFKNLRWFIYRDGINWGLRLLNKRTIIANFIFAKI